MEHFHGEERPRALCRETSDIHAYQRGNHARYHGILAEEHQRSYGVCSLDIEAAAVAQGQRLGQDEVAVHPVDERDSRREEERHLYPELTENSTQYGADDEAQTKGRTDEAEVLSPLFGRADVGDVGRGRREARTHDPGHDAAEEQPPDGRGKSDDDVVDTEPEERDQQDGTPPEAVAQASEHGREQELHDGERKHEPTAVQGSVAEIAPQQVADELRENRDDDAKTDDIEQEGYEDEPQCGFTSIYHSYLFLFFRAKEG